MKAQWSQYISFVIVIFFFMSCAKRNNVATENFVQEQKSEEVVVDSGTANLEDEVVEDCETQLYNIIKNSDFERFSDSIYVRIEENRNDTIIVKTYIRNNLSDDERYQQMVESAVAWLVIFPQRDGIYQSLNALDPEEPSFEKLKIDKKTFDVFVKCIDNK
ncbi:MAG: hypothetical protein LBI73_05665 [Myroides sp.]|jgi:hypothetical protein|nr:hypothetical protein [Myroides sp.]